jgi:methionyl-tRNA synthetase
VEHGGARERVRRPPGALEARQGPGTSEELEATLASLVRQLARQAVALVPFMPERAEALWTQLGAPGRAADQRHAALPELDGRGWRVQRGAALFPRPESGPTA